MSDLVKLTGLYRKESRSGNVYYTGRLGAARCLAFLQPDAGEGEPDLVIFVAPREEEGGSSNGRGDSRRQPAAGSRDADGGHYADGGARDRGEPLEPTSGTTRPNAGRW